MFLESQWAELTDALCIARQASQPVFAELCRRYSEPSRFYHTLTHVAQMLQTIEQWRQEAGVADVNAVRLAAWFHDAVYDSRAGDNEAQSAQLMRTVIWAWDVPVDMRNTAERLILATKTHIVAGDDHDGGLLLDADLAILGSAPDQYLNYSRAIRDEFAWVPEADYRLGRGRVLQMFLDRPRIYHTPMGFAAWEQNARRNIAAEIGRLHG